MSLIERPQIVPEAEAEGFPSNEQVLGAVSQLQFFRESEYIDQDELAFHFVSGIRPPTMEETIPLVIVAPQNTLIALHESTRGKLIVVPVGDYHGNKSHALAINHKSVSSRAGKLQGDPSGLNAIAMRHHIKEDGTGGYSMMDACVVDPEGGLSEGRASQDIAFILMFVGMDAAHPHLTSTTRGKPLNLGAAVVVNTPIE